MRNDCPKKFAEKIIIRHLLSHESGIPRHVKAFETQVPELREAREWGNIGDSILREMQILQIRKP